ncbi:pilus assembly protein PilS [Photobacterium sanctipauli]|uniref:Pilus assembly protein PilS n=1 Tax=Photobacterium sanctipauli TaxID=1342794 RepID=A0A2T3NSH0_9GAMM|nr:PilN domain-containing protein [Photobacterium sanctipauli]PSW19234.1 pilus assembly protein PilS [Photobacterium sanctipauli]
MIAKLNLLPWREERRRQHRQRFTALLAGVAGMVAFGLWLASGFLGQQQQIQHERNSQLSNEIRLLEQQLSLLPEMDRQRDALSQRLAVITDIQKGRNHITRLMSLLPSVVPQGVYLKSLVMTGSHTKVEGVGDSNGRLATLLSNAESSEWLSQVNMHSIVLEKGEQEREKTQFKASFVLRTPQEALLAIKQGKKELPGD